MRVSILVVDGSPIPLSCFLQWFHRETANSPLDRMTMAAVLAASPSSFAIVMCTF